MAYTQLGGESAVVDLPAISTAAAVLTAGDVVQTEYISGDGVYSVTDVAVSTPAIQAEADLPVGVVVGEVGQTFRIGEEFFIRTYGVIYAQVNANAQNVAAQDGLYISNGVNAFVTLAAQPAFVVAIDLATAQNLANDLATTRGHLQPALALEASAVDGLIKVFMVGR